MEGGGDEGNKDATIQESLVGTWCINVWCVELIRNSKDWAIALHMNLMKSLSLRKMDHTSYYEPTWKLASSRVFQ